MRVAVCGSHRVGKTLLIENLQKSLPHYDFKEEAYYELEQEGFAFSDVPTVQDYIIMLEHSIQQINESSDNVILDRCPIDMLAYIEAVRASSFDIQLLYQRVQDAMNEIDLLVFVPIENPDLIECADSELPELRKEVNNILKDWVRDFSLNVQQVQGSTKERSYMVVKGMKEPITNGTNNSGSIGNN